MLDAATRLATLSRPAILVAAARHGVAESPDRLRLLRRVLRGVKAPPAGSAQALGMLLDREAELEAMRLSRDPSYGCAAHVEAVTALLMEARGGAAALPRAQAQRP